MAKIKWEVSEAPTGQYRSFSRRAWPMATVGDDVLAFKLTCDDEYVPAKVKVGDHAEIWVYAAVHASEKDRKELGLAAFQWRCLKQPAETIKEAHPSIFENH